jgi:hypothetical protein
MATIARNISATGRRQRLLMGAAFMTLGVLAGVGLVAAGAPRGLRLLLFVPFAAGAVGILQARDHT